MSKIKRFPAAEFCRIPLCNAEDKIVRSPGDKQQTLILNLGSPGPEHTSYPFQGVLSLLLLWHEAFDKCSHLSNESYMQI